MNDGVWLVVWLTIFTAGLGGIIYFQKPLDQLYAQEVWVDVERRIEEEGMREEERIREGIHAMRCVFERRVCP